MHTVVPPPEGASENRQYKSSIKDNKNNFKKEFKCIQWNHFYNDSEGSKQAAVIYLNEIQWHWILECHSYLVFDQVALLRCLRLQGCRTKVQNRTAVLRGLQFYTGWSTTEEQQGGSFSEGGISCSVVWVPANPLLISGILIRPP